MCLLTVFYRTIPGRPIVLAANRDEFLDRQGEPPRLWKTGGVPFLAPRDPRAGGTWIGCNANGMAAAVTNRALPRQSAGAPSRGLLTAGVLACTTPADAADFLRSETDRAAFSGFNLLCADSGGAFIAHYNGDLRVTALPPGVHIIGNTDLNDAACWKVARARALIESMDTADIDALVRGLKAMCADHTPPNAGWPGDPEPICVHDTARGTLSSSIISISSSREVGYLHAQGRPCEAEYLRYSAELRA